MQVQVHHHSPGAVSSRPMESRILPCLCHDHGHCSLAQIIKLHELHDWPRLGERAKPIPTRRVCKTVVQRPHFMQVVQRVDTEHVVRMKLGDTKLLRPFVWSMALIMFGRACGKLCGAHAYQSPPLPVVIATSSSHG